MEELTPEQLRELAKRKEKEAKEQKWFKRHAKGVRSLPVPWAVYNNNQPFRIGNDDAYIEFDGPNKQIKIKGLIIRVHDEIKSEEQPASEVPEKDTVPSEE